MTCMCFPQPPVLNGFCTECGQPAVGDLPELTGDQVAKMMTCGNCDRDQENLCDDCPARMQPLAIQLLTRGVTFPEPVGLSESRRSELFPCLVAGRQHKAPDPVMHDQPQPRESVRDHARRLLKLKSKRDNVTEIMTMIPETLTLIKREAELRYTELPDAIARKKREEYVAKHVFTQYIAHLLKIRILGPDASYLQAERVMEGVAEV